MQSIKNLYNRRSSAFFGFLPAASIAFMIVGCAPGPATVKMEPKPIAMKLGVPDCMVSVPLSQSEVIEDAKRMGSPNPEESPQWTGMVSSIRQGDQLRLVNCLSLSRSKNVGDPYYYALIRDGKIISKFHIGFFD